jgi:hypothetical protein
MPEDPLGLFTPLIRPVPQFCLSVWTKPMPLQELRNAWGLSQKMLTEALGIQQPAVAKIEKRADMYISTLRSHIEAMGGQLDITAHFPDGSVRISNFSRI